PRKRGGGRQKEFLRVMINRYLFSLPPPPAGTPPPGRRRIKILLIVNNINNMRNLNNRFYSDIFLI
ncbi:hypothetical protein, partial [Bacteroides sp. UBA939]|uniref:hypothetical protein n=1 Tax=Bacteroides sp. UBA939 TaxID=1946092 RepID=UPI0025B990F3